MSETKLPKPTPVISDPIKGVEIPSPHRQINESVWPFSRMEVGDMITATCEDLTAEQIQGRAASAARCRSNAYPPEHYVTRVVGPHEVRIWRTK